MRVMLLLLLACLAAAPVLARASAQNPAHQPAVYLPFISTSSPGRIAYVNDDTTGWSIRVVNGDGSGDVAVTDYPLTRPDHPSWSPDGTRIVFDAPGQPSSLTQIYVMQDDGSNVQQLTNDSGGASDPAWSPDGSQILFVSRRDGNEEIYVMDSNGSHPTRLTNHPAADREPAWSPDGSRIVFTSLRDGNEEIYTLLANGLHPARLTNHPAADTSPAWSPHGQLIAFCSQRGGAPGVFMPADLYLMNSDGSGVANLTSTAQYAECGPSWSSDSRRIAFSRGTVPPQPTSSTIFSLALDDPSSEYLAGSWRYNSSPAWTR